MFGYNNEFYKILRDVCYCSSSNYYDIYMAICLYILPMPCSTLITNFVIYFLIFKWQYTHQCDIQHQCEYFDIYAKDFHNIPIEFVLRYYLPIGDIIYCIE